MASPPSNAGGAFPAAERAYTIVETQIDEMSNRADRSLETAQTVIDRLSAFAPITPPPDPTAPSIDPAAYVVQPSTAPAPSVPATLTPMISDIAALSLGDGADLVADLDTIDQDLNAIGSFDPSIAGIAIPAPPPAISVGGRPTAPDLERVALPEAPAMALPALDELANITIPTFTFPTLPTFDGVAPEFDGDLPAVSALAQWSEPAYATEVMADVLGTVRQMLAGQTGLPQAIEQALYERARSREDQAARQNVQQAFDTWAGRGFEMPPGMLAEQVNAAQEQAALRTNAASRDIAVEVARIAIENVRQAVAQGIAAEQALYNIFNNGAQRSFEMARARVDAEVSLFNAQVSLFNAKQTAYQVAAQVFESKLRAALSELEVYKAQIDGARALSDLNESKVRVYAAKIEGLKANVDVYRVQMEGAKVQSEMSKNVIDGYRAEVEAYRESIAARKVEFDAYESQVRGEAAKVGIIQAQAEAFAATVRAVEAKSNVKVARVRARTDALQARVGEFTARTQYEREKISAQAQVAQAKVSAFAADVQRYSADLSANTAQNEAQIRSQDVFLRTQLAQYEIAVKRYESLMQTIVSQAQLQSDAVKAAGQMASQLAAGAFAAMHVQASVRGGGDINYSESNNRSVNYNTEF